jgi:hypothetical protein
MALKQCTALVVTFLSVLGLMGCAIAPTPTVMPSPEPTISPDFTTYTDEQGLFSISYPQDWEPALSLIPELEGTTETLLESIESDLPLEKSSLVFFAGIPNEGGYDPTVNIVVESLDVSSLNEAVEAEIRGIKLVSKDYKAFTQTKVAIGGKEAVLVDHEYTIPGTPRFRTMQMMILQGKVVWIISCTTFPENFPNVQETCNQIARSFRILQ